jgi:hypothetical protein
MILVQVSIPYPVIGGQRIMPDTLLRQGDTDSSGTNGAAFIRLLQAEKNLSFMCWSMQVIIHLFL